MPRLIPTICMDTVMVLGTEDTVVTTVDTGLDMPDMDTARGRLRLRLSLRLRLRLRLIPTMDTTVVATAMVLATEDTTVATLATLDTTMANKKPRSAKKQRRQPAQRLLRVYKDYQMYKIKSSFIHF